MSSPATVVKSDLPITLPTAAAVATARMPGLDVARAFAVLGMILVNYRARLHAYAADFEWLAWSVNRTTGKAAAVFVLLAGLGVTLRSRDAVKIGGTRLGEERRSLLKRAAVLFGLGLLDLHIWNWDILHCYGVYLAFAALLLRVPSRWLWTLAVILVAAEATMLLYFDYDDRPSFWSVPGLLHDLFFNGVHPAAPWMAIFLAGMWLGRCNLLDPSFRLRLIVVCGLVFLAVEAVDHVALRHPEWLSLDKETAKWLRTWPRPPRPMFVVSAISGAICFVALMVTLTQHRTRNRVVLALTATGQMAFTLYLAHVIAVLIPIEHGLFKDAPLETVIGYGVCFYFGAIAFSVWWRNRWPYGPLEGLLRQVTGPASPALWGGVVFDPSKVKSTANTAGSTSDR